MKVDVGVTEYEYGVPLTPSAFVHVPLKVLLPPLMVALHAMLPAGLREPAIVSPLAAGPLRFPEKVATTATASCAVWGEAIVMDVIVGVPAAYTVAVEVGPVVELLRACSVTWMGGPLVRPAMVAVSAPPTACVVPL